MECKFTDDWEVLTSNGFQSFNGIKKTNELSYKITFNDGSNIVCSFNHKFYEDGKFIRAYGLKIGDKLSGKKISAIEEIGYSDLYDLLEVKNGHHYTANDIEVSNCAFIPKNVWDNFYSSTFPTISSGKDTKMILVSTPNSRNHFYDFWVAAQNGESDMVPVEVNWWDVPGRDESWHQMMLRQMTEEQFEIEYGNSFDVSSNTLLSKSLIRKLSNELKDPIESSPTIKIYEKPIPHHFYILSVDCAYGNGGDYSIINVIDITEYPFRQVAIFSSNNITYYGLPAMIFQFAQKYNDAKVLVESNDIGSTVLYILVQDLEYDNVVKTYSYSHNFSRSVLGQKTTARTKLTGCNNMKEMLEMHKLTIVDKQTMIELEHFEQVNESFAAGAGFHDDRVMTLVNFCYYITTNTFEIEFEKNARGELSESSLNEIKESLAPIPLFSGNNYGEANEKENLGWLQ